MSFENNRHKDKNKWQKGNWLLRKSCETVPLNPPRDNNLNTLENSAKYNQEKTS
jgi:hypothetical protein